MSDISDEQHELLDRISIISNNFNDYVVSHPYTKKYMAQEATRIDELLGELYQLVINSNPPET